MSVWTVLNWGAWLGCAVFAYLLAVDFIRVEKGRRG